VLGLRLKKRAFALSLITLRRSLNTEDMPHFVYPIRNKSLHRKNSFLLSALFVAH